MTLQTLLVANRGEIAIRITRAASELGLRTVAVHSTDDAASLHTRVADVAFDLGGTGAAAYLDIERVLAVAKEAGADAIHPGYGFLSENPAFARRCAEVGITFVGPSPDVLALFGDKAAARAKAAALGVPVLQGTPAGITVDEATTFMTAHGGPIILKAIAGGGGRGSRVVSDVADLPHLFERCRSEAASSFGDGTLFAEELLAHARHVEVQIVGDGAGGVSHLWERECSLQRRHQKIVEMAPAPGLDGARARRAARRRGPPGDATSATAASARSSSSSTPTPVGTCSSRPTRGCRSSTPSPRRSSASTSCAPSSSWPPAGRWRTSGSTRLRCRRHGASPCSAA